MVTRRSSREGNSVVVNLRDMVGAFFFLVAKDLCFVIVKSLA